LSGDADIIHSPVISEETGVIPLEHYTWVTGNLGGEVLAEYLRVGSFSCPGLNDGPGASSIDTILKCCRCAWPFSVIMLKRQGNAGKL
jgi:hypothetical protein